MKVSTGPRVTVEQRTNLWEAIPNLKQDYQSTEILESPSWCFEDIQENLYQVGNEYAGDRAEQLGHILQDCGITAEDYA
jgi:hypothetical protein